MKACYVLPNDFCTFLEMFLLWSVWWCKNVNCQLDQLLSHLRKKPLDTQVSAPASGHLWGVDHRGAPASGHLGGVDHRGASASGHLWKVDQWGALASGHQWGAILSRLVGTERTIWSREWAALQQPLLTLLCSLIVNEVWAAATNLLLF